MSPVKEEAKKLIDQLPETVTWSEVAYTIYVREKIERGVADAEAGRVFTTGQVQRRVLERLKR